MAAQTAGAVLEATVAIHLAPVDLESHEKRSATRQWGIGITSSAVWSQMDFSIRTEEGQWGNAEKTNGVWGGRMRRSEEEAKRG